MDTDEKFNVNIIKNKSSIINRNINSEQDIISKPQTVESTVKPKPKKKLKNKCNFCKKKIGLVHFNCKCEFVFCAACRYPEKHNCNKLESIKNDQLEILKENNPKCDSSKIDKI